MSEPPKHTYTQDEVTEILKRALRQQGLRNQTLSHDELVQMADEVGIDRESLEAATTDLAQSRAEELRESDEARELAEESATLQPVRLLASYVPDRRRGSVLHRQAHERRRLGFL